MTDATYRGPAPNEPVNPVYWQPHVLPPIYHGDQREQPRGRGDNVARDPYAWTPGYAVVMGLIGLAIVALLATFVFFVTRPDDPATALAKKEAEMARQVTLLAIGVADANARTGVPTDVENGKVLGCTGKCWDTQKVKAAVNANARAGFGSNSGTDTVTAVAPPNNIAAPAPEVKIIYQQAPAPAYVLPRSTCGGSCYVGPSASLPGKIGTCDNGQQTNRPRPVNGVWEPKVNPRSGQCTWWNAEGAAPQYRS